MMVLGSFGLVFAVALTVLARRRRASRLVTPDEIPSIL